MGFFERLLGRAPSAAPAETATAPDGPESHGAPSATPVEDETVTARITEIEEELARGGDSAALREELGGLHEQQGAPLEAIAAYEASLEERPRYGESYNRLMDLYNTQRSQAAEAGDGNAINQWMSKIDDLLAISKRIMRENY